MSDAAAPRGAGRTGAGPGWRAGAAVALLVFVVTAWPAVGRHAPALVVSLTDDAFYYFGVARNVVAGHGFTFDGLHPTNGFQPLWLFLLLPVFAFVPGADAPIVAVLLLQAALLATGAWLIGDLLRRRAGPAAGMLVVLAFFALPGARSLWLGMESALVLCTLAIAWRAWLAFEASGGADAGAALRFGVAAGFMALARLEGLIGALAVIAVHAAGEARRGRRMPARTLAALVAPIALLVGGYMAWSLLSFGTAAPVSGQVKAYWVSRLTAVQRLRSILDLEWPGRHVMAFITDTSMLSLSALWAPTLLLLGGLAWAWRERRRIGPIVRASGIGFPLIVGGAVSIADQVVVGPYLGEWAMVPIHLATAIAAGFVLARAGRAVPWIAAALAVVFALRIPQEMRVQSRPMLRFNGEVYQVALSIRQGLPADSVVESPFSGVLAYYCGRPVVNVDGLVNSPEYLRTVVRGGRWEEHARRVRPTALVDVDCGPESSQVGLRAVLGRLPRGAGCLTRDDRIPSVPMSGSDCVISTFAVHPDACDPAGDGGA